MSKIQVDIIESVFTHRDSDEKFLSLRLDYNGGSDYISGYFPASYNKVSLEEWANSELHPCLKVDNATETNLKKEVIRLKHLLNEGKAEIKNQESPFPEDGDEFTFLDGAKKLKRIFKQNHDGCKFCFIDERGVNVGIFDTIQAVFEQINAFGYEKSKESPSQIRSMDY